MPHAHRRRTGAGAGDLNPLQTPGYSPAQRRILLALLQHAIAGHEHVELVAMKQRKASSGVQTIGSPPMRAGLGDSDAGDRLFLIIGSCAFSASQTAARAFWTTRD